MDPINNHWEYSRTKTDRQFFENIKCKYTIMINKYLIIGSIFALIKIFEIKLDKKKRYGDMKIKWHVL